MARKQRKEKDPFEDLNDEFRAKIDGASETDLREEIANIALADGELMAAKQLDQDLKEKRQAASIAGAIYREGFTANRLKQKYIRQTMESRGLC